MDSSWSESPLSFVEPEMPEHLQGLHGMPEPGVFRPESQQALHDALHWGEEFVGHLKSPTARPGGRTLLPLPRSG